MAKKPKATQNRAENVETEKVNAEKRRNLAAQLGEITLVRNKLVGQIRTLDARYNQIAAQIENLNAR